MKTTKTNSVKDSKVAHKLIHTMDFNLLRAQKTVLNNMLSKKKITDSERAAIEGILNLIDTIQDLACDEYGENPDEVYNFTEGDNTKFSLLECRKILMEL